ncbi:MAG: hypothetical protein LAN71_17750 [Acidobacteriia bacterium]|nr:hypothetical protein [Terriglobia bacterium]
MKNIILPAKELRLLSSQLQNFNTGYTVPQIRSLDKVIRIMETTLEPFEEKLKKILTKVSEGNEKERDIKKQQELEEFMKSEGEKAVSCSFEDVDFEFIKLVWEKMATLSGQKEAREAILKIDDAIQGAKEPIFTNGDEKKKLVN